VSEEPTRDRGAGPGAGSDHSRGATAQRPRSKAWQAFLTFLEIIGLRAARPVDTAADLARFRLLHAEFRKLLSANNTLLETIADLERKSAEQEFFDTPYVQRRVIRAVAEVHAMVESLAVISGDRYPGLRGALRSITAALTTITTPPHATRQELALDLPAISASQADLVGGKMANLGEARNVLGLPTPDGFAVTIPGFRAYLDAAGLSSALLEGQFADPRDLQPGSPASARQAVLAADVPEAVAAAIAEAADRLAARSGVRRALAVRSSAVGEDGVRSFAGQFLTELNIRDDGLVAAYRRVVASLYSTEAATYRRLHGIPPESAAMAVGFVEMVDAVAAGVVFSRDPTGRSAETVLIHAVRGLGVTLVDGSATPDAVIVSTHGEPEVLSRAAGLQDAGLSCRPDTGVEVAPLAGGSTPLSDADAVRLARWALALEAHFGAPQDVEWALDGEGRLWVLQSRPLRMSGAAVGRPEPQPGALVLLAGGSTAYGGVGSGPVVVIDDTTDLESFPDGGVLVARRPSPGFVRVMARARAIVTDVGSTTGHMASLARELRVPALLATRDATRSLPAGQIVTVDSAAGFVYAGAVPGIAEQYPAADRRAEFAGLQTPELRLLHRAAELIVPLNLTEPRSREFAPERCLTLHDIARFVHEKSYEEMFRMGQGLGDLRHVSYQLDVFLPIDLYIIDLGGGLAPPRHGNKVKSGDVTSVPLNALLRGMLDRRIPRFGPRQMDLGGFVSVMMRHAMSNPEQDRTFRDPSYALVSDCYLNYTARVGYHFGVVDSYCSETSNKNYISMQFKGGAADRIRRGRRARAIAGVLRHYSFAVRVKEDLVSARLSKPHLDEALTQLEMLGRLLQFFRQMDAAMTSDEAAEAARQDFIDGNFGRAPTGD
jgi:pyruvate, water dikinase